MLKPDDIQALAAKVAQGQTLSDDELRAVEMWFLMLDRNPQRLSDQLLAYVTIASQRELTDAEFKHVGSLI